MEQENELQPSLFLMAAFYVTDISNVQQDLK